MKSLKYFALFALCAVCARANQWPIVSTADWNTNAEIIAKLNDDNKNKHDLIKAMIGYQNVLMGSANKAQSEADNSKQVAMLFVAYFDFKLAHQLFVENMRGTENYDDLELGLRVAINGIRDRLARFNFHSGDRTFAQCYREFRDSFDGRAVELMLRAP